MPKLKGYDVVQIINPIFLDLKANKILPFYKYIRRNNKKLFMGAFGMDHYWVKTCLDCQTFRYSDFNMGDRQRTEEEYNKQFIKDWLDGEKTEINKFIAKDCDGIITGLYEYDCCYRPYFPQKTCFIPFPINLSKITPLVKDGHKKVRFFVGTQKGRSEYKGTDIMLRALERIQKDFPNDCEILKAESIPFEEYSRMINDCDILLDQIYGYSPGMNALLAMSKGKIVVGGAEDECYRILNEDTLRPMVNVIPDEEDVYNKLKWLIENKDKVAKMQQASIEFINKHHLPHKVAERYLDFWDSK
jgi:glycosyltransferase involved in cell wall biosynthesis